MNQVFLYFVEMFVVRAASLCACDCVVSKGGRNV